MSLSNLEIIFIDAQTTGIKPPKAHLIEFAWARSTATAADSKIHAEILTIPEDSTIPRMVLQMTGLSEEEIRAGRDPNTVLEEFEASLKGINIIAAHYCQFEKPFVDHWYESNGPIPEFRFLCLHKLSQILFPQLPSRNIKALAGFFGPPLSEANRAGPHVEATLQIWRGLCAELEKRGLQTIDEVFSLIENAPKPDKKTKRREYRIDSLKRLQLPDQPGIYKMIAQNKTVLYVGKATSLKSRVNSYFRGFRGREKRKLEMMAQVWDIEVIPCKTPLEAALLESDEIKRLNPPYNVALKDHGRAVVFFRRDFLACSREASEEYFIGPFRSPSRLEQLFQVWNFFETGHLGNIFYDPVEDAVLHEGLQLFLSEEQRTISSFTSTRDLLLVGMQRLRTEHHAQPDDESEESESEDAVLSAQDVADKFHRLFTGAAAQVRRARKMGRLLRTISPPPKHIEGALYDRLSILTSAQIKDLKRLSNYGSKEIPSAFTSQL